MELEQEEQQPLGLPVDQLSVNTEVLDNSVNTEINSSFEIGENSLNGFDLLARLEMEDLTELRKYFFEKKILEKVKEPKGSAHPRFCGSKLTKNEFISAIENVIGSTTYTRSASILFDNIVKNNIEEHKEFLWWEQILDAIIDWTVSNTYQKPWNIVKESLCTLHTLTHCKRETIIRVVPVETPTSFCYVMVSKYGRVGLYDWHMNLLEQYEVRLGAQLINQSGDARRTTWITDAVYLHDATMILLSASDRSLHVYAASGLVHVPTFHISGLPNIPTCLTYNIGATTDDPSMLLIGDDHGSITTINFQQPQYSLFRRNSTDRMDTYFWKELESQSDWVTISVEHQVHRDEVLKVEYFSDNNTVVSCSNDPNTTLVIRHLAGRRAPYIFKMSRGVRCFHLDRVLKLLVTGSKDSVVRLWNPVITKKSVASLFGHKTAVVDVRILKHLGVILSMSKDAALKVWDISDQCCLQSLPMLFPVFGAFGRTAEFGVNTFYPGPVCAEPPVMSNQSKVSPRPSVQRSHPASLISTNTQTKQDRASAFNLSDKASKSEGTTSSKPSIEIESTPTITSTTTSTTTPTMSHKSLSHVPTLLEAEWNRMELLVACCNYIVILQLSERELGEGDQLRAGNALPPPLREQDPAVPSPWLTADPPSLSMLSPDHISPKSSSTGMTSPLPTPVLDMIQKGLGEEIAYQFKALNNASHNLNSAMARQYTAQKHVRSMVEQCAPHLALNLSQLEEIKFTQPLPTTARMRNFDLSNPDKLLKAKLKRDSSSTVGSKLSSSTTTTTKSGTKKISGP